MATLFYNGGQEDAKGRKLANSIRRKIISDSEMSDPPFKQIISEKDKDRDAPTVVAELNRRIAELTDRVTGTKTTAANAIEKIESVVGQNTFILDAVKTAREATAAESAKVKTLEADYKTLATSQQDAVAAYKALEEQFKTKAAALAEEVRTLTSEKTELVTAHAAAMKANDATWQEKISKQAQEIDTRIAQVSKLTVERDKLKVRNGVLTDLLRDKKKTKPIDLTVREAGKIKEVMPSRDVCFIPLGSKDRVVRGMTFRVYGPEGIPTDGDGHKASLTVIRVFNTISQCRVTTIDKDDPVAIGDPFANIAFDPSRPPVFVVEGRFDLSGMGRLTETGTKEVIALIKRSGGKVTEKLSVDVDFVVMGPEPSKPADLEEDAPGPAKKAHEIRMEEYNRWRTTLDKAIALNVPKLNTKRFMTLTGYDSVQEYKD
jgi:hypothetical protein